MTENPFTPPKSDLEVSEKTEQSVLWKIYFFFITIISFLGMAVILMSDQAGMIDLAELLCLIIATLGLFGFAFSVKIFKRGFWIPFLVFYLITGLAYESLTSVDIGQGMSDGDYLINLAISYFLSLPGYYALYRYGSRTFPLWNNP